ncbi:MAG: tetratricopeptide repeat protein [Caldisericia bacterium]|nr:tetratricopeptide repeat protein [Caldisericia bacterium]MDD4615433.1 tetratricopeptide repeat protein [Caldisericia bacterium]
MEETVEDLLEKSKTEEKHKNYNQAIIHLEKARMLDEYNKDVNIALSRLYMIVGKPIQGLEIILHLNHYDKDPDYLLQLSNIYLTMQRFQEAENLLLQALDIQKTAPLYNNLAVVMMRLNKGEQAVLYLYESLQLNDTNPNTYFNLATYYETQKDISKSEQVLKKARSKCETAEIDDRLIRVLLHLHKPDEASQIVQEGLSRFPDATALVVAKARILLDQGHHEDALLWIADVSTKKILPRQLEQTLLDLKLEALSRLARFDQALGVIDHLLQNPKANPLYLLKKANLLVFKGDYKGAIQILSDSLKRSDFPPNLRQDAVLMLRDIEIVNWQKFVEFLYMDPNFQNDFLENPFQAVERRGIILPLNNIQRIVDDIKKQRGAGYVTSQQGVS